MTVTPEHLLDAEVASMESRTLSSGSLDSIAQAIPTFSIVSSCAYSLRSIGICTRESAPYFGPEWTQPKAANTRRIAAARVRRHPALMSPSLAKLDAAQT